MSPVFPALAGRSFTTETPGKPMRNTHLRKILKRGKKGGGESGPNVLALGEVVSPGDTLRRLGGAGRVCSMRAGGDTDQPQGLSSCLSEMLLAC